MGQGQLTLGRAQALPGLPGLQRQGEGPGIGVADVLGRHPDDPPGHVGGIAAAIQHPGQPVERRVGVRAAHGLVQGRDLLVEHVALAIEAAIAAGEDRGNDGGRQDPVVAHEPRGDLEQVQRAARVAVGAPGESQQLGLAGD